MKEGENMSELIESLTTNETQVDNKRLTPADEKILWAMVNPEHFGLSISERCKRAGISRTIYYRRLKDPEFMKMVNEMSKDLVRDKAADILNASIKCAISSGARGYQDRRMLLEMMGIVVEKKFDGNVMIVRFDDD
jgi:hypothetical protein